RAIARPSPRNAAAPPAHGPRIPMASLLLIELSRRDQRRCTKIQYWESSRTLQNRFVSLTSEVVDWFAFHRGLETHSPNVCRPAGWGRHGRRLRLGSGSRPAATADFPDRSQLRPRRRGSDYQG